MMINRQKALLISKDIEETLKVVAIKHGLLIVPGKVSFNSAMVETKIKCIIAEGEHVGSSKPQYQVDLEKHFPDYLNKKVGKYKIVGYNPRARKHPFVVTIDGRKGEFVTSHSRIFGA